MAKSINKMNSFKSKMKIAARQDDGADRVWCLCGDRYTITGINKYQVFKLIFL
jgi:hypothetical protein